MENLMPKVAELLGVEIGEEFGIKGSDYSFKFTTKGLYSRRGNADWYGTGMLKGLLNGEYEIIKKPWKPTNGEPFYYVLFDGDVLEDQYSDCNTRDITLYKTGNCFKTCVEITPEKIDKFMKFYEDDTQVFNVLEE